MPTCTAPPRLGAHPDGTGTRFAVWSAHAAAVELCLFDPPSGERESRRVPLRRGEGDVWQVFVPGAGPGQLYGYRVDGPWDPGAGHRFNPAKLLVDPWARAVTGEPRWHQALLGTAPGSPRDAPAPDRRDSAPFMPRCVVVDPAFDWGDDRPPAVPWEETVIYECHVKGLTRLHPGVPEPLRGTYRGLASKPVIEHLKSLGVTAVELLPVHQIARERHLARRGLPNYWGYSPLAFFAPHAGYATGGFGRQVAELKEMVRNLHRAGLEVLIDVVFNHTAEGGEDGPTLSLRGFDNAAFYRLEPRDRRRYVDLTGCGNTLDLTEPAVLELVVSCLRYWAQELRVDGFRFDLAPTLGRHPLVFTPEAPLFAALGRDPVLSRLKLIAEPWDAGPGGYHLGGFPGGWAEWNDRFRDAARAFWRGDPGTTAHLATRLAGSRDLFGPRSPRASVNLVTCHDGPTLADLVSYEGGHHRADGEPEGDGHGHHLSRNWGVEGPTEERGVQELRQRAQRNLLATLALSWGVPMLSHGDEVGRTQGGDSNPYCHDDERTWVDWSLDRGRRDLLAFTRRLFELRRRYRALWRGDFPGPERLTWLLPSGAPMGVEDWQDPHNHGLGVLIRGAVEKPRTDLLLLLNSAEGGVVFHLPGGGPGRPWRLVLASAERPEEGAVAGRTLPVPAYSLVALEGVSSVSPREASGPAPSPARP